MVYINITDMKPSNSSTPEATRNRFTLRQLEAFVEVARLGTASAAATRLMRTQSAISMSLQELESALGCTLFERRGRQLVQTDAANELLPRAMELVDRARELGDAASGNQQTHHRLAVGASRTVGPFAMPALISRCGEQLSGLHIQLTVANTEALQRRVRRFELDCAFVEGDVSDPGLHKQAWLPDELCLVARNGHPVLRSRKPLRERLSNCEWVLRESGSASREVFLRAIAPLIAQPRVALELNDPETQKRCVRDSNWLTCISRQAVQEELRSGALREVRGLTNTMSKALTRRFWIVTHPDRFQTDALKTLLDLARQMQPTP